jgi:voltage-gated potassium channel
MMIRSARKPTMRTQREISAPVGRRTDESDRRLGGAVRRRTAMVEAGTRNRELKSPGYEIFIGALSVLSIVNLVLLYVINDKELRNVLFIMDVLFSGTFLIDFTYRLLTAPSKSGYFFRHYGWADLLASLPVAQLKVLRLFRILRVYRLLRQYGAKNILHTLGRDRAGSALYTLLFLGVLVLEFGSYGMLRIEQNAPGANITNASDAVWYTIVTISTVGYGDKYPVTNGGRVLGSIIIVIGVGIFGTFTGYLANFFLRSRDGGQREQPPDDARVQLEHLKQLLTQQQSTVDEIDLILQADGR